MHRKWGPGYSYSYERDSISGGAYLKLTWSSLITHISNHVHATSNADRPIALTDYWKQPADPYRHFSLSQCQLRQPRTRQRIDRHMVINGSAQLASFGYTQIHLNSWSKFIRLDERPDRAQSIGSQRDLRIYVMYIYAHCTPQLIIMPSPKILVAVDSTMTLNGFSPNFFCY